VLFSAKKQKTEFDIFFLYRPCFWSLKESFIFIFLS
jgi:hypothetical protein